MVAAIISGPVRPIPVTAWSIASQLPIVFGPSGGRLTEMPSIHGWRT